MNFCDLEKDNCDIGVSMTEGFAGEMNIWKHSFFFFLFFFFTEESSFWYTGTSRMGQWCSDSSRDGGGDVTVPKASETPAAWRKQHCRSSEAGRLWSGKQESHTAETGRSLPYKKPTKHRKGWALHVFWWDYSWNCSHSLDKNKSKLRRQSSSPR